MRFGCTCNIKAYYLVHSLGKFFCSKGKSSSKNRLVALLEKHLFIKRSTIPKAGKGPELKYWWVMERVIGIH